LLTPRKGSRRIDQRQPVAEEAWLVETQGRRLVFGGVEALGEGLVWKLLRDLVVVVEVSRDGTLQASAIQQYTSIRSSFTSREGSE
jgi:hypothetical protein